MGLEFLKRMAGVGLQQRRERRAASAPRFDQDLPFGIEIGSVMTGGLSVMDKVAREERGPLVAKPPEIERPEVVAFGRMPLPGGITMYRFYFGEGADDYVFRCIVGRDGVPMPGETIMFVRLDEVYPESTAAWNVWLPPNPSIDGHVHLIGKGVIDLNGIDFLRTHGDSGMEPLIDPLAATELVYADPFSETPARRLNRQFMTYCRALDEEEQHLEWATLSAVDDGTRAYVEVLAGYPLEEASFA